MCVLYWGNQLSNNINILDKLNKLPRNCIECQLKFISKCAYYQLTSPNTPNSFCLMKEKRVEYENRSFTILRNKNDENVDKIIW